VTRPLVRPVMSPMKPPVLVRLSAPCLFACSLLGVSATYAVAWGMTLWAPFTRHVVADKRTPEGWPLPIEGPDGTPGWWSTNEGIGILAAAPMGAKLCEGTFAYWKSEHTPACYRAGWPCLAVGSTVCSIADPAGLELRRWGLPVSEVVRRGLNTSDLPQWAHPRPNRRLGVIPLVPGFLVNATFFAMVAASIFSGASAARRIRRVRRGECGTCGYDRRATAPATVCPECGSAAALTSPSPAPCTAARR
jgi:hypothetical protein